MELKTGSGNVFSIAESTVATIQIANASQSPFHLAMICLSVLAICLVTHIRSFFSPSVAGHLLPVVTLPSCLRPSGLLLLLLTAVARQRVCNDLQGSARIDERRGFRGLLPSDCALLPLLNGLVVFALDNFRLRTRRGW